MLSNCNLSTFIAYPHRMVLYRNNSNILFCSFSFCILLLCITKLHSQSIDNPSDSLPADNDSLPVASWFSEDFVYGIDLSKFTMDHEKLLKKNHKRVAFIMCRATEGIALQDEELDNHLSMARKNGLLVGAYHQLQCDEDAVDQAKFYMSVYEKLNKTDLPPIVKIDENSLQNEMDSYAVQIRLLDYINYIERKLKCKPIIHTNLKFANKHLTDALFSEYAIWISTNKDKTSPELPKAWKITLWTFWQKNFNYTDSSMNNDLELFNGNYRKLQDFIKESK